jgi:hypothetical protein
VISDGRLHLFTGIQICRSGSRPRYARVTFCLEARQQIEAIAESHWMPQAGDAGMALAIMDEADGIEAGVNRPALYIPTPQLRAVFRIQSR